MDGNASILRVLPAYKTSVDQSIPTTTMHSKKITLSVFQKRSQWFLAAYAAVFIFILRKGSAENVSALRITAVVDPRVRGLNRQLAYHSSATKNFDCNGNTFRSHGSGEIVSFADLQKFTAENTVGKFLELTALSLPCG